MPMVAEKPVRLNIVRGILLVLAGIFALRLAQLQLLQSQWYRERAEAQAIKRAVVYPPRGIIYDRSGLPLVENVPAFSISLTPAEFPVERTPLLAALLNMDSLALRQQVELALRSSRFTPLRLVRDADFQTVAAVEEHLARLPGVSVELETRRVYRGPARLAHVLGYVREIAPQHLEHMGDYYRPGDPVGYTGVEASYEPFLRGEKGYRFLVVNALGQPVAAFRNSRHDIPAHEGFDIYLSIDARLQAVAEQLLQGRRGAIVVIDPQTGEVLSLVSKPDYDLEPLNRRDAGPYYAGLLRDADRPLFNRALQALYPPGSTWKMVLALAALQDSLITEETLIICNGGFAYGGRIFRCHHVHGAVNVVQALRVSCNVFFYQLGLRVGLERLQRFAALLGFGRSTGIDIPGESQGIVPSRKYYDRRYGKRGWSEGGRLVNLGIGQGELSVTPLQMAVYAAALATGVLRQPHVVRALFNKRTGQMQSLTYAEHPLPIRHDVAELVRQGMEEVVHAPGGTASGARVPGVRVCGKTGTAQNPHGNDHAWFIGFAPRQQPRIAFCIMVENAGFGGAVAAPIARRLLEAFFFGALPDSALLHGQPLLSGLQ
ncbi:MAG: penicillin-binding protein 2 [Candidatus Kapabacteria bacterium]|nr:penicillin-binding protein 2 [Candidatus Kapabacteria bacterium]MDW8224447.1 penicillin-binding protein 2 [Bacteroidota bacterium]